MSTLTKCNIFHKWRREFALTKGVSWKASLSSINKRAIVRSNRSICMAIGFHMTII